ncbi:hypothetical protein SAMN02910449_0953 [Streptococcus equinus]|uniref:hypothetical protein n=1 Tax=Streptococcus equinus TaxID=1335 RepID=UPI000871A925|nr:hypothetical protein [Streptococcus equinus]SCW39102.1 hypothetical protein SAMN02910449_0953 [Streptococcus equinus]
MELMQDNEKELKQELVEDDNVLLEFSIENDGYQFATSITDALAQADHELVELNETIESIKGLKPECDEWDYALAGCSGALCGLMDMFLVGKPEKSKLGNYTDKWFEDRTKDFAKLCGWSNSKNPTVSSAIAFLEKKFKIPYDQRGAGDAGSIVFGLTPGNHHFKSLGHNPTLLGLFFSILDQFSNTSHFVSDGKLISLQQASEGFKLKGNDPISKLFFGFVNWFGHLISDVSGASGSKGRGAGIPSPFWSWTNDLIAIKKKFKLEPTDFDKKLNELAVNIYKKGYDARFQTTQAIPVLVNELTVRFIYATRRAAKYFSETSKTEYSFETMWKKCEPFSNVTVKRMLTVAHGTFCLVDAIGAIAQKNPEKKPIEFVMRLNIVGVGRFAVSLYGEAGRAINYKHVKENAEFASRQRTIVNQYIDGLNILAKQYNDADLVTFVYDFKNSNAYVAAFEKSVALAKLRNVPSNKILNNKKDIDNYFGGK